MKKLLLTPAVFSIMLAFSCGGNDDALADVACDGETSLSADVMPLIESNCAVSGCHLASQSPALSSTSGVLNNSSRIRSEVAAKTMPPAGSGQSLTDLERETIICWVQQGALDN